MKPKFGTWTRPEEQAPPLPQSNGDRYICTLLGGIVMELEYKSFGGNVILWALNGVPVPWKIISYMPMPRPSTEHHSKVLIGNNIDANICREMAISDALDISRKNPVFIFSHAFSFSDGKCMELFARLRGDDHTLEITVTLADNARVCASAQHVYSAPVSIFNDYKIEYAGETYIGTIESLEAEDSVA